MAITVNPTVTITPLPEDRLLGFYTEIGTVDRFTILQAPNGVGFALEETAEPQPGERRKTYTFDIRPVIIAAAGQIIG